MTVEGGRGGGFGVGGLVGGAVVDKENTNENTQVKNARDRKKSIKYNEWANYGGRVGTRKNTVL